MRAHVAIASLLLGAAGVPAEAFSAEEAFAVRAVPRMRPLGPKMGPPGMRPPAGAPKPNPALEKWRSMTPGERQRFLDRLPPERREEVQRRWEQFERNDRMLKPDQRDRLQQAFSEFRNLPPERQQTARRAFRQWMVQPEERRATMRGELESLRGMAAEDRRARMDSEDFKSKFSKVEQGILHDLTEALPE